jgi:hypothetical protein
MWIDAFVHVAIEVVGAMEPRAGSDQDTAAEPLDSYSRMGTQLHGGVIEHPMWAQALPDIDGGQDLRPCRRIVDKEQLTVLGSYYIPLAC